MLPFVLFEEQCMRADGAAAPEIPYLVHPPFSDQKPAFVSQAAVEACASEIGQALLPHLEEGIALFVESRGEDRGMLSRSDQRRSWLWAVKASRFNAIYYTSRKEAAEAEDFIESQAGTVDAAGDFIDSHGGVASIANFALHSYARSFGDTPGKQVQTARKSIPRYAIQGYDTDTIVVRKAEFLDRKPIESFWAGSEIHDWHDLSHILAASVSRGIFGVKYHDGLDQLERYYRALTEGEGMADASGPLFSDGLLFTQLSKGVFEYYESQQKPDGSPRYGPNDIHRLVAQELFAYLGGEHAIYHPMLHKKVQASRPIDPLELAVCLQNKRYERRAAEYETALFIRGTPEGPRGNPENDPLYPLSRSQRVKYIAGLDDDLLYFEARNLIRHRAHEDALGQFGEHLLRIKEAQFAVADSEEHARLKEEVLLLEAACAFYRLDDVRQGQEINLYQLVREIASARQQRINT